MAKLNLSLRDIRNTIFIPACVIFALHGAQSYAGDTVYEQDNVLVEAGTFLDSTARVRMKF